MTAAPSKTLTPTTMQQKEIPPLKRAVMQVMAGGSAGFLECCIMQPLDVIKTRLQLQNTTSNVRSEVLSVFDAFGKIYRQEGLRSFWKGLLPPLLAETPKRACKFLCFEQTKPWFLFGSPTPTPVTFMLAGITAGVMEGIVVNPFEVVKINQQADKSKMKEAPSTWQVTKRIINRDGVFGLYKAISSTMFRNGIFNGVYFGFYHSVRTMTPAYEDNRMEFLRKVALGFVSGTMGCFFNIPFDVVKSRIQGPQPQPNVIKYKSMIPTMIMVYREEGFGALYKGIVPKVMRLGPGGAIMLLAFEYVYEFLQHNWN